MEHVLVAEHRQKSRKVLLAPQAERPIYGVRADCPEFLLTQPPVDFGGQRIPLQVRWDALRVEIFDGKFGINPLSWGSVCNAFVGAAARLGFSTVYENFDNFQPVTAGGTIVKTQH